MTKRMLIDAVHPEETRVVVLNDNQIDEFDFESSTKSPLRGNIYLAKVTRVEPSLQAAFVEYGGNRHGFSPLTKFTPIIIKYRSATVRSCCASKPKKIAKMPPRMTPKAEMPTMRTAKTMMKMAKPAILKMWAVTHMKKLQRL